jgi:uncharacterized phage protein (TIGR01671 family)
MATHYRAWHIKKKLMLPVVGITFNELGDILSISAWNPGEQFMQERPEVFEIMPRTGRLDTNKKEICSGDYITDGNYVYLVTWDGSITRMMQFDCQQCVAIKDGDKFITSNGIREYHSDDWISNPEFWEVIGNKYENPDLIPA